MPEVQEVEQGERVIGVVKWFNSQKGYGFIRKDDVPEKGSKSDDIFVHYKSLQGTGYKTLKEGDKVEFSITRGRKGMQAQSVIVL